MGKKGCYALVKVNLKAALGMLLLGLLCAAVVVTASAAAEEEGVEIPVVMYHAVLKDSSRQGSYVISPSEFENDLRYLQEHGYTTILIGDLIAYARGERESLPEKPVLLTFDDGYYNNYLYAYQTAKKYGAKFVISPIAYYTEFYTESGEENAYYTHVTWDELREMADSGLVEVQNHSYRLHDSGRGKRQGIKKLPGETEEAYEKLVTDDLLRAQEAIEAQVGTRPTAFVYPFGAMSKTTPELVKSLGFSCTLSCEEKISRVTRDPQSLYGLGRYLRASGISSESFFEKRMKLKP